MSHYFHASILFQEVEKGTCDIPVMFFYFVVMQKLYIISKAQILLRLINYLSVFVFHHIRPFHRPVHHPVHRGQHPVHGPRPSRHGPGDERHPQERKLCESTKKEKTSKSYNMLLLTM